MVSMGSVMRDFMWKIGSAQPPESIQASGLSHFTASLRSTGLFEKLGIMKTKLARRVRKLVQNVTKD